MPHPSRARSTLAFLIAALVSAPLLGCAAAPVHAALTDDAAARLARVPVLNVDSLEDALALILPHPGESKFDEIPWVATLLDGRREAANQGKPIVAFMMSGHPKGCT